MPPPPPPPRPASGAYPQQQPQQQQPGLRRDQSAGSEFGHCESMFGGAQPGAREFSAQDSITRRVMFAEQPPSTASAVSASEITSDASSEEDDSSEEDEEQSNVSETGVPDVKKMGKRDGVQESLHTFLEEATDMYPSDRIFQSRARRLTISDDKFRMMHLLKYPHLSEALASMLCFLCTFWLGNLSSRAVWYQYAPTTIDFGAPEVNGSSHRFPPSSIFIGPRYVFYGDTGGSDFRNESLNQWKATACDTDAMRPWHKFYNWTRNTAEHSPAMRNLTGEAGCFDYNQVSCRRMELQNTCHNHPRRNECPWTCRRVCQRANEARCFAGCATVQEFQRAWCDYRESSVQWVHIFSTVFWHSMIIVFFSLVFLILFKFNRLVVTICVVVQLTISVVLGLSLFYLSLGHPSSEHDHAQFLRSLEEPVHEPLYDATNQLYRQVMKRGVHLASGFGFLWIGWFCLMVGSFSALAWWGQVFACGQRCSVPGASIYFLHCAVWCVVIVPLMCMWKFFGRLLGIPTCDSTWDPPEFGTPHKFLGTAWEMCICCPLPRWIGNCVGDMQGCLCHFMRTLEWNGFLYIGEVASDVEQAALKRHGIVNTNVQNYLAWRRSVLVVSISFGIICLPFKPNAVLSAMNDFREMGGQAQGPNTFDEFRLEASLTALEEAQEQPADPADEPRFFVRRLDPKKASPLDLIVAERQLELLGARHPAATTNRSNGTAVERVLLLLGRRLQQEPDGEVEDATDVAMFTEYLTAMASKGMALIQKGSQEVSIYGSVIDAVTEWTVVGIVVMAHSGWMFLPSSRSWVLAAWSLNIFSPFLISLVPASLFIDTTDFEALLTQVLNEVIHFASLEAAVDDCWASVNSGVSTVGTFHSTFQTMCDIVLTSWAAYLLSDAVLEELGHACNIQQQVEDSINWQSTERAVRGFCSGLQSVLVEGTGGEETRVSMTTPAPSWRATTARPRTADEITQERYQAEASQMIKNGKQSIVNGFTFMSSMQFALGKIFSLIPAVLALCPALIMASYKFRLLIPHSTMPVMFMLVLPLVYCPLTWIQYSIVIQLVPEPFICVGIGLQSFGLLMWSVMVIAYDYHEPFSRPLLNRILKQMGAISVLVTILTYVFIVIGALRLLSRHGFLDEAVGAANVYLRATWRDLTVMLFQLVCDIIFKLWLSKVAAYDYILSNITAEYEYGHAVQRMREKMKRIPDEAWQNEAERQRLDKIQKILDLSDESWDSLNALVELHQHGDLAQFQDDGRL